MAQVACKTCRRCGETKPLDDFYRDKSKRCGIKSPCRACHLAQKARYYDGGGGREQKVDYANRRRRA